MKVLVATNDITFSIALSSEYLRRGFEVHVGINNIFRKEQNFDLIHFQWPEDLVNWLPVTPQNLKFAVDGIDWWKSRSNLVCTVHNLLPHAASSDRGLDYALYSEFYARMSIIGHFSNSSLTAVRNLFPELRTEHQFVHGMNSFENLKKLGDNLSAPKSAFNIDERSFLLTTFGAFRTQSEVDLVHSAIDQLNLEQLRIIFAGRLPRPNRRLHRAYRRIEHSRWVRHHNVIELPGYIEDQQTVTLFRAADGVIIPRFKTNLNSGLLALAMTFGTPVIAPDYGVFRELLGNSENELYIPGSSKDLAAAIVRLSKKQPVKTRQANLDQFKDWGWERIVDRFIDRLKTK